jgi:hypothetical protein
MDLKDKSEYLEQLIIFTKSKQQQEQLDIKNQFVHICDSLKPINIVTETVQDIKNWSSFKADIVTTSINVVSNLLSNYLVLGRSTTVLKKIGGFVLQFALSKFNKKRI